MASRRLALAATVTVAVAACAAPEALDSAGPDGAEYHGPPGMRLVFVDPLSVQDTPWWLEVQEESWEWRRGDRWRDATPLQTWSVRRAPGLWVDDTQVLPRSPEVGAVGDGVEVTEEGEASVHYGTFPWTVQVQIDGGALSGEALFAAGVGPILLTLEGKELQLGTYETVEDAVLR